MFDHVNVAPEGRIITEAFQAASPETFEYTLV
jgi:hypothetical protein